MRLPWAILGYARDMADIQVMVDACTAIGLHQIRKGYCPPIWESPVRYQREVHETLPGVERVNTAEESHALGADDCDGLGPYAAASYQSIGVPARAVVMESPGVGYHVVCVYEAADGSQRVYDPSAERGMLEGAIGSSIKDRVRRHVQRARGAVRRLSELERQLSRLNPASAAFRALREEARRLTSIAHSEAQAADELELEEGSSDDD